MSKIIPQKLRAQVLWEAGFQTPKSLKRRGKIPIRSGERYIKDFREGVFYEEKKGYKWRLTQNRSKLQEKILKKAQDRKKRLSLREIATASGISHGTVRNVLINNGFSYRNTQKRVHITEETKEKRLKFAKQMSRRDVDWTRVIFTDECSFWLHRCKKNKAWTSDAMEIEGRTMHGPKVHVWGAITSNGPLKLKLFTENLNTDLYVKILREKVKEMRALLPNGFIFQHDGSPIHRSATSVAFVNRNMGETLTPPEWPPYSPDLSPIENIWGWLKGRVNNDMPTNMKNLKQSIRRHWKSMSRDFLRPYYESMKNRMRMVIKNRGGKINY